MLLHSCEIVAPLCIAMVFFAYFTRKCNCKPAVQDELLVNNGQQAYRNNCSGETLVGYCSACWELPADIILHRRVQLCNTA